MRGVLSKKLNGFIMTVNEAIAEAKASGGVATPELAREKLAALGAFVTKVPNIAFAKDRVITAANHDIPVKVYSPSPAQELPVLIYFHGGGHMCGSADLYDPMCRNMSLAAHCIVINVDYRLAPEFPYPDGIDDAEYVVKNYQSVLQDLSFNNKLVIGGDSAGGAICTSLTMRKTADPALDFSKQILIYPSVDYTMSSPSIEENGTGFFLEKARIDWYFDNYFVDPNDRKNASPLYGPVNAESPESLVILAGCDPLRDEGASYARKLVEAGVSVEKYQFDNMIHAFMNLEDLVPEECSRLYQLMGDFVNK